MGAKSLNCIKYDGTAVEKHFRALLYDSLSHTGQFAMLSQRLKGIMREKHLEIRLCKICYSDA